MLYCINTVFMPKYSIQASCFWFLSGQWAWSQAVFSLSSVQAALEETPWVAHEALTGLKTHITTSLLHDLEQWDSSLWVPFIYLPPPSWKDLLNRIEERRIRWKVLNRKTQVVLDRVGYRGRYFLWYRLKQTIPIGIDSLQNERYPVSILLTEANFPRAPPPCSSGQDTQPTHTHCKGSGVQYSLHRCSGEERNTQVK